MIIGETRRAAAFVDRHDDRGIVHRKPLQAWGVGAGGQRSRQEALLSQLIDRRRVVIKDKQPVTEVPSPLGIHGREGFDERHGHGFEAEIGHHQRFGLLGTAKASQLRFDNHPDIGVTRYMNHPMYVGVCADYRRRPIPIEVVVGHLRELHPGFPDAMPR